MKKNNQSRETKLSTSKCVYLFFPFSNYQKLHCLLGNLYNFAVVYILFLFAILPVPRDIMIPSSFILAITHSIVPIDVQHVISAAVCCGSAKTVYVNCLDCYCYRHVKKYAYKKVIKTTETLENCLSSKYSFENTRSNKKTGVFQEDQSIHGFLRNSGFLRLVSNGVAHKLHLLK